MFCRPIAICLVLGLSLAACGRKEPPKPPPSKIPAQIADLTVQQRGLEMLLRMSYPAVTMGGLPIEDLDTVEVYEMVRVLPSFLLDDEARDELLGEEGDEDDSSDATDAIAEQIAEMEGEVEPSQELAEEPDEEEVDPDEGLLFRLPTAEDAPIDPDEVPENQLTVSGREFYDLAELSSSLSGTALSDAVMGDRLLVRIPILEIPEEPQVHVLAARSITGKRQVAAFSNLVKLLPRQPPAPPSKLAVDALQDGVEITWTGAEEAIGYRIYRRSATVRDYGEALATAGHRDESFLDRTALFNQRYIYTVTSILIANPLVESSIVAEYEVDYQDRFAPEPPTEVVALPEPGRVRLLWDPSLSEDVKGYWIFRQAPGEEFQSVTDQPVVGSEYLDRDLPAGVRYRYYLVAVDESDNSSQHSIEIEVSVP